MCAPQNANIVHLEEPSLHPRYYTKQNVNALSSPSFIH